MMTAFIFLTCMALAVVRYLNESDSLNPNLTDTTEDNT